MVIDMLIPPQPLVEVMDVDTDSVDEADSDYEDELEEDKVSIIYILVIGQNSEYKQQHVGGSNDLAPVPGSRRKGATKSSTKSATPPTEKPKRIVSTSAQIPKPKPVSKKMSVVPKGKGKEKEKAPVDDKPKIKLQMRISSSGRQYIKCGVMSGTCDQCLKHSLTCMLWEGKGKRIALSCSFCASSKKKCTFDGTASSDFNKNALKPVKDVFPKANCISAPMIESVNNTGVDVQLSSPAAESQLASAADFPADNFVFDPNEDEMQVQVQSTVTP
ncbi:hypothetical protein AZE42_13534, partial [Rhizopogon vesiculosus]